MKALRRCLAVLVVLTAATARAQTPDPLAWPALYDPYTVLSLNLQMTDEDWNTIRHDTTNEIEVPCQFWADGESPILASCRRKSSRPLPSERNPIKIGMKVDINEFVDGQKWHGVTKISLENGADTDPIAEGLAWNLHEMASVDGFYGAGYHAGLASWVRVYVNGQFVGVYINVEERDSQFLRNRNIHFGSSRTWLYEIDETDPGWFEHEVGGPAHSPLWNELNFSPFQVATRSNPLVPPNDAILATYLPSVIDMPAMLTQGAIDAFSSNNDALFTHGKNFRFADFANDVVEGDPPMRKKRLYFIWDLDAAITNTSASIYAQKATAKGKTSYTQTAYQQVILNHPQFRQQYNAIMTGLIEPGGPISEGAIHTFLNALEATSLPTALAADPYAGFGSLAAARGLFSAYRDWASKRVPIVRAQVTANVPAPRP